MDQPTRLFDFPYYQLENFALDMMMTSKVGDTWVSYSTKEFIEAVNNISKGLLELGVQPGDKIALISHNNRCEWNIMDHGILQVGAIDVPIYPTMTESDYEYILNHSESKFCFVSNADLHEKVSNVKAKAPMLKEVYTFEEVAGAKNWNEVLELGKNGDQSKVDEIKDQVREEHLATIIYTSGTTGLPKGVMLSHKNVASNSISSTERLPDMQPKNSRALSFLPVCHVYERMLHYLYMYNGVSVYFAQSLETIKEDLAYSKPHIFSAVPRLLEKFYDGISTKGKLAGGVKKMIFEWAEGLAFKWQPERANGGYYHFLLGIADKLVYSKIRLALGLENIKAVASGSAALQPRLAQFFTALGIPVLEGYGLTETSPVITVNTLRNPNMMRIGHVGKAITGVEVKIAEDGEVLCKGPNVMMGYYKDEEKTNEVLKNDWFHTGDIGEINDDFLKITDRKKEMFKTSGGKYVAPQLLENSLKASHLIEQLIVIGEGRKFPSALIVASEDGVKEYCRRKEIDYTTHAEMLKNEKVLGKIERDVAKANSEYGAWEQIKKYELLSEPFTIEGGELTPTLKLKRKPIKEKYKDLIENIYA
ncbi:MAG: long-chain fatty acid--CoA ligase [Schleiferiaceae bacterium]|nr:long-chain fatty acid--CoA ligase [Schleiferiaceae bacterium]